MQKGKGEECGEIQRGKGEVEEKCEENQGGKNKIEERKEKCEEMQNENDEMEEKYEENQGGKNKIEERTRSKNLNGMTSQETKMGVPNEETDHYHHLTNNLNNVNTDENECTIREQDQFMPIANIIRIMRKILPSHAKISDEAKETIQECVSEFIGFITGEANERCKHEQRKTITADDIHWAIAKLGFDDYVDPLSLYLYKYRMFDGGERGSLKRTYSHPNYNALGGITGFEPSFRFKHFHGFFETENRVGGLLRDEQGAAGAGSGSSGAALASPETSEKCKEQENDG